MDKFTIEVWEGTNVPKSMCSIGQDGKVDDCDGCKDHCDNRNGECENCEIQKCFNRLAEYESLGVTPGQIKEMDKTYLEKCKEVNVLNQKLNKIPIPKWIPCSERLPETPYETFIVWLEGENGKYIDIAIWEKEGGFCPWYAYYFEDCPPAWEQPVLAWMPLPEPYCVDK